ncbi:MAG: HEAT repeat domain-containing protein [Elusimicrobiota bacterium]|nr:HEAT repeat domain-containing protein [Elusimicrobiota bacterium]
MKRLVLSKSKTKNLMKRIVQLGLVVLGLAVLFPRAAYSEKKPRKYANLRAALEAARNAKDAGTEDAALDAVADSEPAGREDVIAIYDAIKDVEKKADAKGDKKALARAFKLARPLQKCTEPKHHAVVAELLEDESRNLPRNFTPVLGHGGGQKNEKETIQFARVSLLMEVAGKGKNRDALPGLRKILNKGGLAGDRASGAISQIGDPQDLDDFVQRVKKDPKAQLDFSGFGVAGIDRIMREVDSEKLNAQVSGALIVRLARMQGPGAPQRLKTLLKHKDRRVVETVSVALSQSMTKDDSGPIMDMLKDADAEVRFQGLVALVEKTWSEDKAPIVINLLKNDPDAGVRSQAASILGRKNVKSAEPELKAALTDRSSRVQMAAEGALKWLSGEYPRQIDKSVEDSRRNK